MGLTVDSTWTVVIAAPGLNRSDVIAADVDLIDARRVLYAFAHQLRRVKDLEQSGEVMVDSWIDGDGLLCEGVRWVITRDGHDVQFVAYMRTEEDR